MGRSQYQISDSAASVDGATSTQLSKDGSDTAYKIYGGYAFSKYFAAEGGFTNFGKFTATRTVTAPGSGSFTLKSTIVGLHVDAVGVVPLSRFALFGKVGAQYTIIHNTASSNGSVGIVRTRDSTTGHVNLRAGVGASFDITRHFGLRVEAEQVFDAGDDNIGQGNIRVLSAGAFVRF